MTATDGDGSSYDEPATGWAGWVVFAAVFMMITGAMNAIQGLAALIRDEAYWVTLGGTVLAFDVSPRPGSRRPNRLVESRVERLVQTR